MKLLINNQFSWTILSFNDLLKNSNDLTPGDLCIVRDQKCVGLIVSVVDSNFRKYLVLWASANNQLPKLPKPRWNTKSFGFGTFC